MGCSYRLSDDFSESQRAAYRQHVDCDGWPEDYTLTSESFLEKLTADRWTCPHDEYADGKCLFHLDPTRYDEFGVDADCVRERFLEAIDSQDPSQREFVGAKFDTLDLSHQLVDVDDNYPIGLHFARVENFDLSNAVISVPIHAPYARFEKQIKMHDTIFHRDVSFFCAEFPGAVSVIDGSFTEAKFRGADFQPSSDESNSVLFKWVHFEGYTDFRETTFDEVTFKDVDAVEFDLRGATIEGNFEELLLTEALDFSEATIGDLNFEDSVIEKLILDDVSSDEGATLSFEDATINGGTMALDDESIAYDFSKATVGAIEFTEADREEFGDRVLFSRTTFNGFDFSNYHQQLEPNWNIHPQTNESEIGVLHRAGRRLKSLLLGSDTSPNDGDDMSVDEMIQTYLRAKNGANLVDDNVSASEFFVKEMGYKRARHRRKLKETDLSEKPTHAIEYAKNVLLALTSRYGESSARTVVVATVFLIAWNHIVDTFRFLSGTVGLFESFFVALVVFTLTRSIHR